MKQNRELKAGMRAGANWGAMVAPMIAAGVFGGLTATSFALGLDLLWGVSGLLLSLFSGFLVFGASLERPMPHGAVPVRCELEVDSAEGDAMPIRIIAVVRVATQGDAMTAATELYGGRSLDDVAAAATALFESIVRAELYRKPRAELDKATLLDQATPPGWFKDAFVRMGLVVDSLWVGPA